VNGDTRIEVATVDKCNSSNVAVGSLELVQTVIVNVSSISIKVDYPTTL